MKHIYTYYFGVYSDYYGQVTLVKGGKTGPMNTLKAAKEKAWDLGEALYPAYPRLFGKLVITRNVGGGKQRVWVYDAYEERDMGAQFSKTITNSQHALQNYLWGKY